jgi:hypothetical protein
VEGYLRKIYFCKNAEIFLTKENRFIAIRGLKYARFANKEIYVVGHSMGLGVAVDWKSGEK